MGELLDRIVSADDIKGLTIEELGTLAGEVRGYIIDSVSKTGGHLASNLGVVELTVALHRAFNFSRDRLLWDVGHQCYAHKILTGRKEGFERLREAGGVSGFPNPAESEYDPFVVGHAGTSIATAMGLAMGAQQVGDDRKIVAVVGDASLVNGLSFEALNNIGLVKRQMLIVLNDNTMAIDPTEGALAKYFSQLRLNQNYEDLVRTTNNILEHLPVIGKSVEGAIATFKKNLRMLLPPSRMFEAMNIPYFGPVDGHDIGSLVKLFKGLGSMNHPAILHVYTRKGKGFSPAEEDRPKFHSTGPFEIESCAEESGAETGGRSFTGVFGEELVKLAEADERICVITAAMCAGTGLEGFRERFPERFYDVGIAEGAAVDFAAGMVKMGLRPVVCIYSTFLQRSFDQIFQEISLQGLGVIFCIDRAGFVGADGPTHHGLLDIGFLRMMPNVVLAAPADAGEMRGVLEYAAGSGKCVCIRYPKEVAAEGWAGCEAEFVEGKGVVVRRAEGAKAVIVSYGCLLGEAMAAAERLAKEGIECEVFNARFAWPVDERIVDYVRAGKGVVTVEDHGVSCGFGGAVLERCSEAIGGGVAAGRVKVLGVAREFVGHDKRGVQLMKYGANADRIVAAVREICG